jgi:hypothetical protein
MAQPGMFTGGSDSPLVSLYLACTRHRAEIVSGGNPVILQFVKSQSYVPPQISPHAAPAVVAGRIR